MVDKNGLELGTAQRGKPGKSILVKNTTAADMATIRDTFGYSVDPIDGSTLIFADLNSAINVCRANLGDTVYISDGYSETVLTAGDIALDVAGISVIGLGNGDNRPVFTFSSTTNVASITITADDCAFKNVVLLCNDDGLTNALNVTGNDAQIDIESQDTSAAIEFATVIRLDTADNANVKLRHLGFAAGNAMVSCIRLDDCDNVRIEIDGYGILTTAWVEMVDAASSNVSVRGRMYTQGITNFTRDVVDTITGSTWDAVIFDASLGAEVSGGSAAALANDDVTALASAIDAVDNMLDTEFPVVATAVGAVADAALADTIEGAAAATQSIVTDLKGVLQRLGADNANNTAATTLVAANRDGSVLERLEDIRQSEGFAAGLVYQGNCDAGMAGSTVTVVSADLAGRGNDFFNNKYYMQILLNANGAGAAPETEVRLITDYVSATGTFTTNAFSVNVEENDEILVVHESLVMLGRDDADNTAATTNVVANTDGSVLERLEFIQQAVGGTDAATTVLGADDADNQYASTNVVANDDGSVLERLEGVLQKVNGTDSATNVLGADDADNQFASTNVVANVDGTVLERLEDLVQHVNATDSATNVLGADNANNAFASTNIVANQDGSILERSEQIQQIAAMAGFYNSANYTSATADFTNVIWNTAAAHEVAVVTGAVRVLILPEVTGTITSAGGNATLIFGDETTTNSIIAVSDAEGLAQGEWWVDATVTRTIITRTLIDGVDIVVGNGKDLGYTIGVEALTGGSIVFHMWWIPVNATGALSAGAGGGL